MFERGVRLIDHVRVDLDAHVSVFETNIRILGGLLSAHLLASDPKTGFAIDWYQSELLELALDLGEAFLPVRHAHGLPYGAINLLRGVEPLTRRDREHGGGRNDDFRVWHVERLDGSKIPTSGGEGSGRFVEPKK